MARSKKKEGALTPEEKLEQALVPYWEQPYKVPKNWCWVRLPAIFENCTDSKKKVQQKFYQEEGKLAVVDQGQELVGGYTDDTSLEYTGNLPVVVFGDHTRCIKYVDFRFAQGADGVKVLKAKDFYLSKAFYYSLQAVDIPNMGYRRHFPLFDQYAMPVPPLAEQQRIVDRIEHLFIRLDEAKEKVQSVLDSFETRKAAILHKAFTGELTAKWRAENGVNTSGWTRSCLGTYADSQYGYTESATTDPIGPHFLRITDIQDGHVDWSSVPYCKIDPEKKTQYAIQRGDIVVARTGATTGKSYLVIDDVDAVYASYLIRVGLKSDLLNNHYLHAFMQSPEYWRQISDFSSGIAQPGVNGKKLKELELPIPSVPEQKEIVRILDSLLVKEQQAKDAAEAVLEKIDLLKKSILARAFRGELGTNDPTEESALELLKQVLQEDVPAVPQKRSKSIPKELQAKLATELERKIVKLYFKQETDSLPAEELLSVSSKKFEVMDSLHNLEQRGILKKLPNGNYRLLE